MKFSILHPVNRRPSKPGFTLVEVLVATGIGTVLVGVIVVLAIFTSRSFFMMANYVDLDAQSRYAVDVLSRKIRNSSLLLNYNTNTPEFFALTNTTSGEGYGIGYYTNNSTLMLTNISGGTTTVQMLLTNCDVWTFTIYNRVPNTTNLTFFATNDKNSCKVINMSWKCSRTMLGTKFTTESVQTAQIALRNKVN